MYFVCLLFFLVLLSHFFWGGDGDLFLWSGSHQNPSCQILLCGALELLSLQKYDPSSNWNISLQDLAWCFEGGLLTQDIK